MQKIGLSLTTILCAFSHTTLSLSPQYPPTVKIVHDSLSNVQVDSSTTLKKAFQKIFKKKESNKPAFTQKDNLCNLNKNAFFIHFIIYLVMENSVEMQR